MTDYIRITDVSTLMEWRREVLACVFGSEPEDTLLESNRKYYLKHIADGSHIAYVAAKDGAEAGCGAICLYDEMPSPDNRSGRCGYIMNMYVRPGFRHEGIASGLLQRLIADARAAGCGKIYLETTDMGREVYFGSGFSDMKDMMKYEG